MYQACLMKMIFCYAAVLLLCLPAHGQSIITFAGKGTSGYSGDGGIAKDCEFNHPFGIAIAAGNLYIADRHNNCVRMINSAGVVTTIAGTGTAGYNGDNIPATAAQLNSPVSVVVDHAGNVCVSDLGNNRIRRVDTNGIITTIAGTGVAGYNGDDQPATAAQLNSPRGLAIGPRSGNVFLADQGNNRVRIIDDKANIITYVGSGVAGYNGDWVNCKDVMLNGPYAIAFDIDGELFIADVDNERIRRTLVGRIITFAGNGSKGYSGDFGAATAAQLNEPIGIAVDKNGILYIADGWNGCIRQVNTSGIIATIAGNGTLGYSGDGGPAVHAQLNDPYGVAVDDGGNIYIADYGNNRIRYMTHPTAVLVVNAASSAISVYPNPNNGKWTVHISADRNEVLHIVVTNVTGQIVTDATGMTNANTEVSVDMPDGVYFITATSEQGVWHQQMVVAK
ncbi:MAG: hypothetical protein JWQ38_521 [Flavipsychrobacter sp.]|nr:hypothetical protein [Flavipsychrobacter sp.]